MKQHKIMKAKLLGIIFLLALSIQTFADESGKCGDNISWTYNETSKTLTISGNGGMYDYSASPFESYDITTVNIQSGITSIGSNTFNGLANLTSINIPNTVTTIGMEAFYRCENLASLNIPSSVTTIVDGAFCRCESLISITIPNSVTTLGRNAFYGCKSVKNLTISNSLTRIDVSAFAYCSSLKSVIIPNSVTRIESSAFANCTSLTTVTIGSSVTYLGEYLFNYCSNIKTVYAKAAEPPTCDICVFEGVDRDNALLFVPETPDTALDLYKTTKSWRLFKNTFSIEMPEESNNPKDICDTNRDGSVNGADVVRIYNYITNGQ